MSDANIRVSVDTSEIDVALAKLDAALERANGVSGDVTAKPASAEQSDFSAFWTRIDAEAAEAKQKVDDTVTEGETKLDALKAKAEAAKDETDTIAESEGAKIKGVKASATRIISMIPGLREAYQLQRNLKYLYSGNIVGIIGLVTLVLSVYQKIQSMLEEQRQREEDYRRTVMQTRNFATVQEFEQWKRQQEEALNMYKNQVMP